MFSKFKYVLSGMALASFLFLGLSGLSQAQTFQTVGELSLETMTQINTEMTAAIESGDTEALEDLMTALAEANPELAKSLASFVSLNLPAQLSSDLAETLIVAVTSAIVVGAPESSVEVTAVIESTQPQFSDAVSSGMEASLLGMDFSTAAGGNDAVGLDNFDTAAGGPALPAGRAPTPPTVGASATAENPSTSSASPTG